MNKKAVTESLPFDDVTLVFKVANKIFGILSLDDERGISLKCDPEKAIDLREKHHEIQPGYHLNKEHWNTIDLNGVLSQKLITDLIDHSYNLIVESLSKKVKLEFGFK